MKASMTLKPLVFAMAAAMAITAQAGQSQGRHNDHNRNNPLYDRSAGDATAYAGRDQYIGNARVTNEGTENSATIEDSLDSNGNIGANVAGGSMNQQANNVAIATADEQFVFGSAEADASIEQRSDGWTHNTGGSNTSTMDNSGNDASGNIGVNVASGNLNQQQNALAIATARGWDADADATGEQNLRGGVDNKAGGYSVEKTFAVTKDSSKEHNAGYTSESHHSWDASYRHESSEEATAEASLTAHHNSSTTSTRDYDSSLVVVVDANQETSASAEASANLLVEAEGNIDLDIDVDRRRGELEVDAEGTAFLDVSVEGSSSQSQTSTGHFDLTKTVDKSSSYAAEDTHSVDKGFEASYSKTHESSGSASAEKNANHSAEGTSWEVDNSSLATTVTYTKNFEITNPVVNDATLSGSLNGSSGNIGVNVAAGSSNQQLNTLAVAVGCDACNNGN